MRVGSPMVITQPGCITLLTLHSLFVLLPWLLQTSEAAATPPSPLLPAYIHRILWGAPLVPQGPKDYTYISSIFGLDKLNGKAKTKMCLQFTCGTANGLWSVGHDFRFPGYTAIPTLSLLKKKDNIIDSVQVYSNFIVAEKPGCSKSTWLEQMVDIFPRGEAWAQLAAHKG